jgi:hypothetical protein
VSNNTGSPVPKKNVPPKNFNIIPPEDKISLNPIPSKLFAIISFSIIAKKVTQINGKIAFKYNSKLDETYFNLHRLSRCNHVLRLAN